MAYDVMQVCLNGHVITDSLRMFPGDDKTHCPRCGAPTISKCEKCQTDIQGHYRFPDVIVAGRGYKTKPPAFCHSCGTQYPWTQARLVAARELAEELEGLSQGERQTLKVSLDDLVRDTPRTTLAATRFKRIISKAGKGAADTFKEIIIGVISEAAKKVIWP